MSQATRPGVPVKVTPSDTDDLPGGDCRALLVGTAGNARLSFVGGSDTGATLKYFQIGGFAAVNDNTPMAFASLPAGGAGSQCTITDSSVTVSGMNAAGGGSTKALVWHNGTAWKVVAA